MFLVDWQVTDRTVNDGEGALYVTFRAIPCPTDERARPFTLAEIDQLLNHATRALNAIVHVETA
jgi:hypothetical protein